MYEPHHEPARRPINGIQSLINLHHATGMEILPRNARSMPADLRRELRLEPEHFAVCGFMGHRALQNIGPIGEAIRLYTQKMGRLEDNHNVGFALLSGGGTPNPNDPDKSGYMGQWVRGISESNILARCLTLQELVMIEGLGKKPGRTVCLQNVSGEARYGERTDGLLCASDAFLTLPGGTGTSLEVFDYIVSFLTQEFARRKMIFVDPVLVDPATGKHTRYMKYDAAMLRQRILCNGMSEQSAKTFNNNTVRYQPAFGLSADEISDELVMLTVAMRQAAPRYAPQAGYAPLPPSLVAQYVRPFGETGSKLVPYFKEYPATWDWLPVQQTKGHTIKVKSRTANHEFVGRYASPTRNGGHASPS